MSVPPLDRSPRPRRALLPAVLAAVLLPLLLAACGGGRPEAPAAHRYEVRALVRALPAAGGAAPEIFLHHEAIPDFVAVDGRVVGMEAMAMSLPIDDPALVAGLAPGDKVLVEFEVAWEGSPPLRLLRVERLPPETVLDFARSEPADGHDAHHGH